MLDHTHLRNILFIDIETVPLAEHYDDLDDDSKHFWNRKSGYLRKEEETPEDLYPQAGIYAEFGKVICISVGFMHEEEGWQLRIKSMYGHDEKKVLSEFIALLNKHYNSNRYLLCAHNGKEFDFPYLSRRILINNLKLPALLDVAERKPWEIRHLDTLKLWKFGDYRNFTSLRLLVHLFKLPVPTDEVDGSQIAELYWKNGDFEKIVHHCQTDVVAVAQLILRFKNMTPLEEKSITIV